MQNITGIVLSMVYIVVVLGIATLVAKFSKGASESSRKLVHILVGNWIFITPMFTELWAIVLVPFTFIIVNSISLKYNLIKAMERNDDSLGTVYYAISLFVLTGAGFVLDWPLLPFIGILTMAYGDGLAAIFGQKWGKSKPFSFAPKKSLVGSATVASAGFVITFMSLTVFSSYFLQEPMGLFEALFISVIAGILASFIELTGVKGCDNLTLPIGSGLFVALAAQFGSVGFYVYGFIAASILIVAYKLKSITTDGIVSAILTAVTIYAFGGVWIGASLLVFFVLGSAVSKLKNERKKKAEEKQEDSGARNWKQVLANSLPAVILLWLSYLFPVHVELFKLLSVGVFAAAAADTFSSEIGMLSKGRVFDILTGKPIPRGVSGGVSIQGLLAGVFGGFLLSLLALAEFGWVGVGIATVIGFFGSLIDSVFGALFQRKYIDDKGELQDWANFHNEKPASGFQMITNNAVNLISLSFVSFCGFLFFVI